MKVRLAQLPTPIDQGPGPLPGGASLVVKRDDLTGLGLGDNKARKLEPLCATALAQGCDVLVTVGGAQSNHCRMTAAAGARLGLPVHLVLGGDGPAEGGKLAGNQLLMALFGADPHFADTHDWGELTQRAEGLDEGLRAEGARPALIPIGGSTAVGASAFAGAYLEVLDQLDAVGVPAAAVVHTSSSGGTHAGLLAGQVLARAAGRPAPHIVAIGVAKGDALVAEHIAALVDETLQHLGVDARADARDVEIDRGWLGGGYEVPSAEGDDAIRWVARHGGLGARPDLHRQGVRRAARPCRRRAVWTLRHRRVLAHRRDAITVRSWRGALSPLMGRTTASILSISSRGAANFRSPWSRPNCSRGRARSDRNGREVLGRRAICRDQSNGGHGELSAHPPARVQHWERSMQPQDSQEDHRAATPLELAHGFCEAGRCHSHTPSSHRQPAVQQSPCATESKRGCNEGG